MMNEDEVEKKMSRIIEKSREWGDKIPIGVLYQNETIPTYEERIKARLPAISQNHRPRSNLLKQTGHSP